MRHLKQSKTLASILLLAVVVGMASSHQVHNNRMLSRFGNVLSSIKKDLSKRKDRYTDKSKEIALDAKKKALEIEKKII